MTTTMTLELELEIVFSHTPGTSADYWHPGDPAEVDIKAVKLGTHLIPLSCFSSDDQEAIQEAALTEAEEYEPDYN
ncbi:hypothetical protein [Spirosoma sordidisoli]|uniref:Uncharacterized protein n=1 Tax=Spirosoma sordidisoli TaxID=2502893 RepID=A0A4Q2UBQ9_9BACT|nr:hypothetical protein [Spirosoma sordidisoli]RYC66493.1 hypothetical protein EQG79_29415 [Spirosoma sordidisoli]